MYWAVAEDDGGLKASGWWPISPFPGEFIVAIQTSSRKLDKPDKYLNIKLGLINDDDLEGYLIGLWIALALLVIFRNYFNYTQVNPYIFY